MSEVSQELAPVVTDVRAQIASLNEKSAGVFSTITGDDVESRKAVFNAVTAPESVSDHLGKTINLANIVAMQVEVMGDDGVLNNAARVILIDADGTAYAGLSDGLLRSLENLFAIIGKPGESDAYPLPIKIVEEKSRKGYKFFTMKLA